MTTQNTIHTFTIKEYISIRVKEGKKKIKDSNSVQTYPCRTTLSNQNELSKALV
jgi:hypothetical protein